MKVNPKSLIQGRSKAFSMLSLFALIGLSSALQHFSGQTSKVLALQDGLQTCFTRVHNTYTARLIGSGSDYLSNNFVQTTEECMGEVIRVYENLDLDNNVVLDDLNAIATDLSWFHQKVRATSTSDGLFDGNPENVLLSNIGSRYEKLEIKKEEVNQGLINTKTMIAGRKSNVAVLFYGVAAIVPLLLAFEYFQRRRQEEILEKSEKEAKDLLKEGAQDSHAVHDLVVTTLKAMGMGHVAQVFEINKISAQQDVSNSAKLNGNAPKKSEEKDSAGKPIMLSQNGTTNEEKIDKIWSQPERETTPQIQRESFELEDAITNVIDHISSKIFTLGIKLDIQTEPIKVYGERESIEQAFYNLLINAIDNYNFDDPNKFLSITTRKLGSTVLVDFFDSGNEYSLEFLRQAKGLIEEDESFLDLSIAQGLIEEQESKISFENVANEDGKLVGRKVQVVLEAARTQDRNQDKPATKNASKRRLARVEKTTKKELLKKLSRKEA